MSKLTFVGFVMVALSLAACSGGGGGGSNVDARVIGGTPDAMHMGTPDAAAAPVTGLGEVCGTTGAPACPANAKDCVSTTGMAPGFCTFQCGTTTGFDTTTMMPTGTRPTAGDTMCAAQFMGSANQARCILFAQDMTNPQTVNWSCAVLCGASMGVTLGGCPGGFTCMIQSGSTLGICN